jgi:hypothetical protein
MPKLPKLFKRNRAAIYLCNEHKWSFWKETRNAMTQKVTKSEWRCNRCGVFTEDKIFVSPEPDEVGETLYVNIYLKAVRSDHEPLHRRPRSPHR